MPRPSTPCPFAALLALASLLALAGPAAAQAPLSLVNDDTEVGGLGFAFEGTRTLDPATLELQIATTAPTFGDRLQARFSFLPGEPAPHPFNPIELQRDVVRLERYYGRSGFPRAAVDYVVVLDTASNRVDVTFQIEEGPPVLLDRVTFAGPGGAPAEAPLPASLRDDWRRFTEGARFQGGGRLSEFRLVEFQSATLTWLRDRGYPFADAGAETFPDSTGLVANVRIKVNPGPLAQIGTIRVEGAESLSESVVLRELPFSTGDRFNASALTEGQREAFGLGLFQLAVVDIDDAQPRDSTVDIVVRVRRGPSRIASAFGGYFLEGGVTGRGQLTHRNFFGGARQATAAVEWRTGFGGAAVPGRPNETIRDLQASLSLRQPYVLDRRLSFTLQPSVRSRVDEIETSDQAELAGTFLFTRSALTTAALRLYGRYRDLSASRGLQVLDPSRLDLPDLSALGDSLTSTTGGVDVDVTLGRLDDALSPRRGFILRPSLAVAGGDVTYLRGRLSATALVPVNDRVGVTARITGGAIAGLGGTDADGPRGYVLLRDQLFFAGGTADVRGWATAQLGPKTLSVFRDSLVVDGELVPTIVVDQIGIGGRAKLSGSLQVNLPFPGIANPNLGANVFLDGGQLWSPSTLPIDGLLRTTGNAADAALADVLEAEGGPRFGAGAGLQYLTPVGFISFAIGVKLNPSYLDLHNPDDVFYGVPDDGVVGYLDARQRGLPFDPKTIPTRSALFGLTDAGRVQFHFSIGQAF